MQRGPPRRSAGRSAGTSEPMLTRVSLAAYALLARAMPRGFRDDFFDDAVLDFALVLRDADRLKGRTVVGCAIRGL